MSTLPPIPSSKTLTVSPAEDGSKLLRFLERHVEAPKMELHKWLRTGQIRLNGKRTKPFIRLETGDIVRVPPFAVFTTTLAVDSATAPSLRVIAETENYLVIDKPAGLAVQGGSRINDSVAKRLQQIYSRQPFIPAPVHRLDRATSGLLLIGKTHRALQHLSQLFAVSGAVGKEYLALVEGIWHLQQPTMLIDTLELQRHEKSFKEQMACVPSGAKQIVLPKEYPLFLEDTAACIVQPLRYCHRDELMPPFPALYCDTPKANSSEHVATLLWIQLITGKKHQIRVQLASRGHPIAGDVKYGNGGAQMYLHSLGLTFDSQRFVSWPSWAELWKNSIRPSIPPLFPKTTG